MKLGIKISRFLVLGALLLAFAACASAQNPPTGTPRKVTLGWQAPSPVGGSGTIAGYNIYKTPAGPPAYVKLNASPVVGLTLVDNNVVSGTQYGYCATTLDSIGSESACTVPVSATTPTNPNPPQALAATAS